MIIEKIYNKLTRPIARKNHKFPRRFTLGDDFSIISCNCIGGLLYHDLNMQFKSPTVNLYISSPDFVKFCLDLERYISYDVEKVESDEKFPVGKIGDVTLNFMHYADFEDAKYKWNERKARINFDKIFVIMTDRDGYTDELLDKFDKIPYPKVLFSHKIIERDDAVYVKRDRKRKECRDLTEFVNLNGVRAYEYYFDFEKWFSGKYSVKECKRHAD